MVGTQPGESIDPRRGAAQPPPAPSMVGPLAQAAIVAAVGCALLVVVAGILASTAGLLFVAGVMGAGVGLSLARARVPNDDGVAALSRRAVRWLAVGLAVAAVLVAAIVTWLYARQEGGTLGPIDYLLTTFGPLVPGELLLGGVAAAWGAAAGPVQR